MPKTSVSFETDDIPAIIDALENYLEVLCSDVECEDCTLKSVTISTAIDALYKKAKKVKVEF